MKGPTKWLCWCADGHRWSLTQDALSGPLTARTGASRSRQAGGLERCIFQFPAQGPPGAHLLGEELLVDLAVVHLLLDRPARDQAVHGHRARLPYPPRALARLHVRRGVPVRVVQQHPARGRVLGLVVECRNARAPACPSRGSGPGRTAAPCAQWGSGVTTRAQNATPVPLKSNKDRQTHNKHAQPRCFMAAQQRCGLRTC